MERSCSLTIEDDGAAFWRSREFAALLYKVTGNGAGSAIVARRVQIGGKLNGQAVRTAREQVDVSLPARK
jgi:hypothetical protein